MAAGGAHGIVIRSDNSLSLFGDNASGQLGDRSNGFDLHLPFTQTSFDPDGCMFPGLTDGSGTAIGAGSTGTGLSLDNLGASVDFGMVPVGSSQFITLTLKNLDSTDTTFNYVQTFSPPTFVVANNGCTGTIAANGGTCQFNLGFSPAVAGSGYSDVLEISSNAFDNGILRYGIAGGGAPIAVSSNIVTSNLDAGVNFGSPVTFTATLSGSVGAPTGTVAFNDNGVPITGCEAQSLSAGVASCTTSALAPGLHPVTAAYPGGGNYLASTSAIYTQKVNVALSSVLSRKDHATPNGSIAMYLPVDFTQPLATATVEPRHDANPVYVYFTYTGSVGSVGSVTSTIGSIGYSDSSVVMLTSVPDNARGTITLNNVNGTGQAITVAIGFLMGDVNNTRSVADDDVDAIKLHAGETVDTGNFKHDINLTGYITAADILLAKGQRNLPAMP